MTPDPAKVTAFIETEHDCEIRQLQVTRIVGTDTWKIDGTAYRQGVFLLVGGTVNEHNFSGVRVFGPDDDPFRGLS